MTEVIGCLSPKWETLIEFLTPSLDPRQGLLWASGSETVDERFLSTNQSVSFSLYLSKNK